MKTLRRGASLIEILCILTLMGMVGSLFATTMIVLITQSQEQRELWNNEIHIHALEMNLREQTSRATQVKIEQGKLQLDIAPNAFCTYEQLEQGVQWEQFVDSQLVKQQVFLLPDDVTFHPQLQTAKQVLENQERVILICELQRAPYTSKQEMQHRPLLPEQWLLWHFPTKMKLEEQ
jgi:hypothetical protein